MFGPGDVPVGFPRAGVGSGAGLHGIALGDGDGRPDGDGDTCGVAGGTKVAVGDAAGDGEGEPLAPFSCVQVAPSHAQSSSLTGTAGVCELEFNGRPVDVDSPPKSSSFPETPSYTSVPP